MLNPYESPKSDCNSSSVRTSQVRVSLVLFAIASIAACAVVNHFTLTSFSRINAGDSSVVRRAASYFTNWSSDPRATTVELST